MTHLSPLCIQAIRHYASGEFDKVSRYACATGKRMQQIQDELTAMGTMNDRIYDHMITLNDSVRETI